MPGPDRPSGDTPEPRGGRLREWPRGTPVMDIEGGRALTGNIRASAIHVVIHRVRGFPQVLAGGAKAESGEEVHQGQYNQKVQICAAPDEGGPRFRR